ADEQPQRVRAAEGRIEGGDAGREPMPEQARDDEREARDHAAREQATHRRVHPIVGRRHRLPHRPRTIISAPSSRRTIRKKRCTVSLLTRSRMRVPANAPAVTPTMTGAARPVSRSPEAIYTLVPASAVTPMIRLLVVVDTFG